MTIYIKRPFHRPHFEISSSDAKLLDSLRLQHSPFVCDDSPSPDTYGIEIIRRSDGCVVKHGGAETVTKTPLYEIDSIIFENTSYDDSVLALHGSAVEWGGRAYLFLADTGSGKTTLASYLTSSGFGYITDDCILIDRDSFQVHPYTCSVHLRDGGLDVLEKLGKAPSNLQFLDDDIMRRHIYVPSNCVAQPLSLGDIYFIKRSETENMLGELSTNEKMEKLLQASITNYELTPDYLRLLGRLVQGKCHSLTYKDMEFVADTIKKVGETHG